MDEQRGCTCTQIARHEISDIKILTVIWRLFATYSHLAVLFTKGASAFPKTTHATLISTFPAAYISLL